MTTAVYTVRGMTCDHCVRAVTDELGKVTGVSGVDVELASGRVTILSETPIDAAAVQAAIDEAGYELVT